MTQKSIKELQAQVQEAQQKLEAMNRKLTAKFNQAAKMQAHAEGQIKKLKAEPVSPRRDHHIQLHGLRVKIAERSQTMLKLLSSFNPMGAEAERFMAANRGKLETLDAEMKFIALEYTVHNYKPVAQAVEASLRAGAAPAAPTGRLGAGAPRAGTGPLSQRAGTGQLDPSKAPPQRSAPSGPLGAARAASPSGPLAQARGTGRLSAAAGAAQPGPAAPGAARPATGPLAGSSHRALQDALAREAGRPDVRPKLEALLGQYQEIEASIALFRGDELGTMSVSPIEAQALINKTNGLIYYMKRTIESLPSLAALLTFEPETADPELQQYMASQQAAAESPAAQGEGGFTSKLKSLFNL